MKIINHRLHRDDGTPYPFRASPNVGGALTPRWLVMHYTAGTSAQGAINWLCNPESRVSAHLVIGRDGSVTQLVPFNRVAWHAGKSEWRGTKGLNAHSIGIELDNYGYLAGGPGRWAFGDQRVPDAQVYIATHKNEKAPRGWMRYPWPQIAALFDVARALVETYGLQDVIGHDDIAPGRKQDPGPAFPMEMLRAQAICAPRRAPAAGAGAVPRINVPGVRP